MKIYSMTATFGKLEHRTITLQPGLNIIEAPNEWGKSTWCAFLVNMLYGIDTRARSTGTALADKERYAPWSGAAMSGRIDLNWNGRDITIERSSKGRIIFGNFRAYETETGIDVPELNGTNCGQMLLGVERSVFTRAGFLKQADLPVTQDDSLRRRLNNLVTTGDESGAGDKLSQTLKDLKNKCRYNRSGLLPQAENERDQLQNQLSTLHSLQNQADTIRSQQAALEDRIAALENHGDALRYQASLDDAQKVAEAQVELEHTKERLQAMMQTCRDLPARETAQKQLTQAKNLQEQQLALIMEEKMLPPLPQKPETPAYYLGVEEAEKDAAENDRLESSKKKNSLILGISLALAAALIAVGFILPKLWPLSIIALVVALAGFVVCAVRTGRIRNHLQRLYDRHPGIAPDGWISDAQRYADEMLHYEALLANAQSLRGDLDGRLAALQDQIHGLTDGKPLADALTEWAGTIAAWDALADARRDLQRIENHTQTLRSMVKLVDPPKKEDHLTYTEEENTALLADARFRQRQLHISLGQCLGQTESLGSEALIKARLETLNHRIARLEDTYYALEMAQDALRDATNSLQRRFAPRISKRAQELFSRLTDGRYQRLSLGQDLSLSASAQDEDTLHAAQWRSDGTMDQQYLALRLAVAEELTPDAPLVLDDAFVRFDDDRLKAAMQILKEEAENKQVILFTCQHREKELEETL